MAKILVQLALWFCACNLLAAVVAAQCPAPVQQVPNRTISSGTWLSADNNALVATSFVANGSANVNFVAGNCIDLQPGFHATAGTAATTFHAWVETPPSVGPVSPASGSRLSQTFIWTASSPAGYSNLAGLYAIFNTSISGSNACYIYYNGTSNLLYLADNTGAGFLGGFVPGSAGSANNSQCSISGIGASASGSGTQLTVTVPVTFQTSFAGAKNIYEIAVDYEALSSNWQPVGTWTVPAPQQYTLTTAVSPAGTGTISPASGSYNSGTVVTITATPANGYRFSSFSGSVSSGSNPLTVSMNGAMTETANFTAAASTTQTVSTSQPGLSFSVDGSTYTTAQTFTWQSGTSHALAAPGSQRDSTGTQYFFSAWSDGGDLTHNVTASPSTQSYSAQYATTTVTSMGAYGVVNNGSPSGYWTYCLSTSQTQCIDGGFDAAGISSCSVLGNGVTVDPHIIPKPNGIKYEFELQFTANRTAWHGPRTLTCVYNGQQLSLANAVTVYDTTPVINSIQQDPPAADGSFYVTLTGSNFGPVPGSVAPCAHATGSPAPKCGNTPTGDLAITQAAPYYQSPPAGAPQALWSDTQVKVLVTPSASASGTYDLVIESIGVYYPGLGLSPSFQVQPGTNAQAESNRKSVTVPGPPTISGSPGIWWLGSASVNDNCNPNDQQNPSCYYNTTKLTVTPGPGGSAPSTSSPATWTMTDLTNPTTGQPPTFATFACVDGPCSSITVTATAQPPSCKPGGNLSIVVTLGGVKSAGFGVSINWPQSMSPIAWLDTSASGSVPGFISTSGMTLVSGCGAPMFNMAWHEEFPTDSSGNPKIWNACNGSQGAWTLPVQIAPAGNNTGWAYGITDADGILNLLGPVPGINFDGIGIACNDTTTPSCSPPSAAPAGSLNMTPQSWSYHYLYVGSQDTKILGKYGRTDPNKQVLYPDHGRDEVSTWNGCPGQ